MNRPRFRSARWLVLVLLTVPLLVAPAGARAASTTPPGTTPVTASVTGASVVAQGSITHYRISGWGGPAVAANGTLVGNVTWYGALVGPNVTGVTLVPQTSSITSNASVTTSLSVTNVTQTVTIDVEVSSVYQGHNVSTNTSYQVHIVQPYVVSATIVAGSTWVLPFIVYVTLDGNVVGNVSVPGLQPGGTYSLSFSYPTIGLSSGAHTFAISLSQEHGLVTFANGQLVYSQTVYVTGPAPDYTLWYVAGIVAFFGAIFIFLTRVAARRRGASRR